MDGDLMAARRSHLAGTLATGALGGAALMVSPITPWMPAVEACGALLLAVAVVLLVRWVLGQ
jgi:hypothetical protein